MNRRITGVAPALTGLFLYAGWALGEPYSPAVQIQPGEVGDALTLSQVSDGFPSLKGIANFGVRYFVTLTPEGVVRLSATPKSAGYTAGGLANIRLNSTKVDLLYGTPNVTFQGHKLADHTGRGAADAWADLNDPLVRSAVATSCVVLNSCNDVTGQTGFGSQYFVNDQFFIDIDTRYRYVNRIMSACDQALCKTAAARNLAAVQPPSRRNGGSQWP